MTEDELHPGEKILVVAVMILLVIIFIGAPVGVYFAIQSYGETQKNKGVCQALDGVYNLDLDKCIVDDQLVEVPDG